MATPVQFEARIDQLRRLKAGDNPDLLANWTGLVFQGWAWDELAQQALDRLANHPYLPSTGLTQARWPSQVMRDIEALRAGMAAGLDPNNIEPVGTTKSVRASAVEENASPEVHGLLDDAQVPGLTMAEVVRHFPSSIHKSHPHSFDYLVQNHWQVCQLAFTPVQTSPLLKKLLNRFHAAHRDFSKSARSPLGIEFERGFVSHVLKSLATLGLDWTPAVNVMLTGSEEVKSIPKLHWLHAQARQGHLDRALPCPQDIAPPRRPRF